jgi:putative DNA primase/helicase
VSKIIWGPAVEGEARDLLAEADANGQVTEGSTLSHAKGFLSGILAKVPLPCTEVEGYAKRAKCSDATLRRAKEGLSIQSHKEGGNFGADKPRWIWILPSAEDAQGDQTQRHQHKSTSSLSQSEDVQQKKMSPFSNLEHLQGDEDLVEEEL